MVYNLERIEKSLVYFQAKKKLLNKSNLSFIHIPLVYMKPIDV